MDSEVEKAAEKPSGISSSVSTPQTPHTTADDDAVTQAKVRPERTANFGDYMVTSNLRAWCQHLWLDADHCHVARV